MKIAKRIAGYIIILLLGVLLMHLNTAGVADPYWGNLGTALIAISLIRLVNVLRYHKDASYQKQVQVDASDERNRFIRTNAWAWAGYLFMVIAGISVIAFKALGQDIFALAISYAACLLLVLYWGSYLVLRKKY